MSDTNPPLLPTQTDSVVPPAFVQSNGSGRSSSMRCILVTVLFLAVVQLTILAYVYDMDTAQVHHVALSWHEHMFGGTSSHGAGQHDDDLMIGPSSQFTIAAPGDTASFVRATVLYLPSYTPKFEDEFRWFRRSWIEMQKYEPVSWRTDIVVYSDGPLPVLEQLNCSMTSRRTTRNEPNRCILYTNYTSVFSTAFPYKFADSVNVVGLNGTDLDAYDWILRTDIDTFLTPAFATWKPPTMVVGRGMYSFPDYSTGERLESIISKLNMTATTIDNVGSTWYGPTALLRTCANLSVAIMQYLYANEFTAEEKSPEYGIQGWPNWHIGVVSMYGGHIAINHCTRNVAVTKDDSMLDFPTSSSESPALHAHLHTWQNNLRFSKFSFHVGEYKNEDITKLRPYETILDYAMYMALDSRPKTARPLRI